MNIQEQSRHLITENRQEEQNRQETMLNRAEAEIKLGRNAAPNQEEKAKELMTEERKNEENRQELMLQRTEEEMDK